MLLKSAFGGGGRGIRMASDEKQLKQEFEMASEESRPRSENSALFIEKNLKISDILNFNYYSILMEMEDTYLKESVQSKEDIKASVEFTPSPVVDSRIREEVGEIAVRPLRPNYLNAGTAEFLRDKQGKFYFIEINSRASGRTSRH